MNTYIRSLTVAAYLRCLYAAIEYCPEQSWRETTIEEIRAPLTFRTITQLCDSTNWDENANISAKYLRVMRHIIKLSPNKEHEEPSMLMHYELIGIVIQKTLTKIMDKMSKDIELNYNDKITIYELSLTFFTII